MIDHVERCQGNKTWNEAIAESSNQSYVLTPARRNVLSKSSVLKSAIVERSQ